MQRTPLSVAIASTLALGHAGCASTAPEWEASFGNATRQARALQVIDPDAASRAGTVPLGDGKAIAGAHKAYAKSYGYSVEEPKAPALPVISTTGQR